MTYTIFVDGVETSTPLILTEGQTVRVRLNFFNAADEDLDDVEGEHFGGLTFEPASLATVTRVATTTTSSTSPAALRAPAPRR